MKKFRSITHKTLMKMAFRIAIVIIITTAIAYYHMVSNLEEQALIQLEKYVTERGNRESIQFTQAEKNHIIIKKNILDLINGYGKSDPVNEFDSLFVKSKDGVTRNRPEIFNGLTTSGVFIDDDLEINADIRRRVLSFYKACNRFGEAWHNQFQDTYVTTPDNIMVIYWPEVPTWAQDATPELYMPDEEYVWVADAKHNPKRETVWTGLFYDHVAKVWMVSAESPIYIEDQHIATIGHDITLNELLDRTLHDNLEGTKNMIFREDGRLIAFPGMMDEIQKQGGYFDIRKSGNQYLNNIMEAVLNRNEGENVVENKKDNEYIAVTKIEEPGWYFVTIFPRTIFIEQARETAKFILLLGLVSLLIEVSILFFVLKYQIAVPLRKFTGATDQISTGDFNLNLDTSRNDELGLLAESFSSMGRAIYERDQKLEQKVMERTAALAREVEERKRAYNSLGISEERLKEAQRIAHLGHWELNLETNNLKWSDEIYRIFEIDSAHFDASYEAFMELIHPQDRDMVRQAYTDSLKSREPYKVTHRLLMPDGRIKHVREACDTKFDEQGKPLHSIGTMQDITEIETMRLELIDEEERYHSLVTNIPAIVYRCLLDEDWTMEYMSDYTEKLTGYPVTDFLHNKVRSYASIIHPEDIQHVDQAVYEGINSNGRYYIEYRIINAQGNIRWVFEKGEAIRTRLGDLGFLDGFIMDITERKNTEKIIHDKKELVEAIEDLQSRFISHPDPVHIAQNLLEDVKKLTESEYGLVGEVYTTPDDKPYLTTYALSMLAWNDETKALYESVKEKGFEFHKLNNLFGHVITDGSVVISNDPKNDSRSAGLPKGHPPINNFLGIPVFFGDKLVGEIGLANRKGGYDQEVLDYITPLVDAYGQVIVARQALEARDAAQEALSKLAKLDGLLGIPNRRSFDEYLDKEWKQAKRDKKPVSLIMIDIDHFKLYNDHYGHQQGDQCLIQVAKIITKSIRRPSDFEARYGGEEFVCVLPDTTAEGAEEVAEAIRKNTLEENIPHGASPVAAYVTLSIGVSTLIPSSKTSQDELISLADQALYQAKSEGRDRVVGFMS